MGIQGKKGIGAIQNEADLVQASLLKSEYEHHTIALEADSEDVSLKAEADGSFGIERAHTVIIRTDSDIEIKFNSASNHAIPITGDEGSFTSNTLEVTDIFLSSTLGATVQIFLV